MLSFRFFFTSFPLALALPLLHYCLDGFATVSHSWHICHCVHVSTISHAFTLFVLVVNLLWNFYLFTIFQVQSDCVHTKDLDTFPTFPSESSRLSIVVVVRKEQSWQPGMKRGLHKHKYQSQKRLKHIITFVGRNSGFNKLSDNRPQVNRV